MGVQYGGEEGGGVEEGEVRTRYRKQGGGWKEQYCRVDINQIFYTELHR